MQMGRKCGILARFHMRTEIFAADSISFGVSIFYYGKC
jgi:hypothetical protein